MDIHRSGLAKIIGTPNLFQQKISGINSAGMGDEQPQQFKFFIGQFYLAAAVTGTADGTRDDQYQFVWYSSPSITSSSDDSYISGGNSAVFMGSVGWMAENQISLSILAKQLQVEALTLTAAQSSLWSVVVIFVLPLLLLAAGFVIWVRRRKR